MRTRDYNYHYLILPSCETGEILCDDVPLLPWPVIRQSVEACLQSRKIETADLLELGYMAQEQDEKTC